MSLRRETIFIRASTHPEQSVERKQSTRGHWVTAFSSWHRRLHSQREPASRVETRKTRCDQVHAETVGFRWHTAASIPDTWSRTNRTFVDFCLCHADVAGFQSALLPVSLPKGQWWEEGKGGGALTSSAQTCEHLRGDRVSAFSRILRKDAKHVDGFMGHLNKRMMSWGTNRKWFLVLWTNWFQIDGTDKLGQDSHLLWDKMIFYNYEMRI